MPGRRSSGVRLTAWGDGSFEPMARGFAYLAPPDATKPVISRARINPSQGKTREIRQKYYRRFWARSLTGAAFRAMTGRTVNPQVPGSSPGRGATDKPFRDSVH